MPLWLKKLFMPLNIHKNEVFDEKNIGILQTRYYKISIFATGILRIILL